MARADESPSELSAMLNRMRNEINQLNRLVEVSLAINAELDLATLLTIIMDYTTDITGAESASVLLMDQNAQELRFVASSSTSAVADDLAQIRVPLEGSIAGTILRSNQPCVVDDVASDPRHFQEADAHSGFATRSLLGVPMRSHDRAIGVLEAVNKIDGHWTDDDQRNMMVLAAQSAVAIENAQLVGKLQRAYEELDQLTKLKDDFIAIASHELRTPLGVILGYASFLKEDAEGSVSTHATAVLNSALRMRNLIEDMTNLRYLKLGEAELEREHIPLAAVFQAAYNDVASLAEAKGQTLHVNAPDINLVVVVDRGKLGMALANLLNNAIKFTPGGGQITLSYRRKPGAVWVLVEDTGIGIPHTQLERIFEEFHQVEDHMTRRHGGMGLGLAIARGLVEAHGGRLWAESEGPGRGSTFTMNLPLPSGPLADIAAPPV